MSAELTRTEIETLIRTTAAGALTDADIAKGAAHIAEDAVFYPTMGEAGDREDLIGTVERFHRAFPTLEVDVADIVYDRDREAVTVRFAIQGTQANQFGEVPPTGNAVEVQGIAHATLDGEDVTECRVVFDRLGLLQDLGVVG